MGLKDFIVTPIYIFLFSGVAYFLRPYVTNSRTQKYFIPALLVRFIGAIALGLVYQFYYSGGDTFNFWEHGSNWIWQAFLDDPVLGVKMLLQPANSWDTSTYEYVNNIWYYKSTSSYTIVKITAFFDLFTFHTYSASALFFATFSFSGLWALYSVVSRLYPGKSNLLAYGILFFPSVVFWGSGILKDTITIGCLGWLTWAIIQLVLLKNNKLLVVLVAIVSTYLIGRIKVYILICFFPMLVVWSFLKTTKVIKNLALKILVIPILVVIFSFSGFLIMTSITENNDKYKLENIAESARITAYDIRYGWGARLGGDGGYDIGELDGTWQSMFRLLPASINVSLFRPYLWEVKNPFMLLSAIEGIIILMLFLRFLYKRKSIEILKDPFLAFCLGFSLLLAYAFGISTFNFGTLMRYKIPMIPFLIISLIAKAKPN